MNEHMIKIVTNDKEEDVKQMKIKNFQHIYK